MKRIILFRYHHQFERNLEFLKFYKVLNPKTPIYGLYGGKEEDFERASTTLEPVMEHNYLLQHPNPDWNWKNSDMSYQVWYRDFGYTLDFDIMHSIEWDILLFEPLEKLFAHGGINDLVLTGLTPIDRIQKKWYWTRNEQKKAEYNKLLDYVKQEHGYTDKPFACIGPGTTLPKSFLEAIKNTHLPDLSNDEVRLPLFAQIMGFTVKDSGFFKKWFSKKEFKFFNSNAFVIDEKTIQKQLQKTDGRRAFHPCNPEVTLDYLMNLRAYMFKPRKKYIIFNI